MPNLFQSFSRVTLVPIQNTEVKPASTPAALRHWDPVLEPMVLGRVIPIVRKRSRRVQARMIFERAFLITRDLDLVLVPPL